MLSHTAVNFIELVNVTGVYICTAKYLFYYVPSMVDMPLDAAFLCDKAAVLSDMTQQMPYIMYCCLSA